MGKDNFGEGKYNLLKFDITTPTKPLDLRKLAVSCSIYESILSPSTICVVTISDAVGAHAAVDFTESLLEISWSSNIAGNAISYKFKIIEVNSKVPTPDNKTVVYTLTGISEEAFANAIVVDFNLAQKKQSMSTVVNGMLDSLKSKKPRFIEETTGLHAIFKSNTGPLNVIDEVRRQSISPIYQGSAYVFFENHRGLHFMTIEKLINDNKKNIGDKKFFNSPTAKIGTTTTSQWRNVLAIKTIQSGNKNLLLATGGAAVRVMYQDVRTGKTGTLEKKISDFNFIKMNEGTQTNSLSGINELAKPENPNSRAIFILIDPDQEQNTIVEKKAAEALYVSEFLSVIQHITIYGDTEIAAGDMLNFDLGKEQTGLTNKKDDNTNTGNYLIAKCRHVLTFGDIPMYYQGLEIVKDGIVSNPEPTNLVRI